MDFYKEIPPSQIAAEKEYFMSAIFKLLPYKQEAYENLDNYFAIFWGRGPKWTPHSVSSEQNRDKLCR